MVAVTEEAIITTDSSQFSPSDNGEVSREIPAEKSQSGFFVGEQSHASVQQVNDERSEL